MSWAPVAVVVTIGVVAASTSMAAGAGLDPEYDSQRARTSYMLNCQGCHLPAGQGVPGVVPRISDYLGSFLKVPGGWEFLVQVPGSANAAMDDSALAELLNWLLVTMSPNELPQPWQRYTAEDVGKLRIAPLREVETIRARLVQRIDRLAERIVFIVEHRPGAG